MAKQVWKYFIHVYSAMSVTVKMPADAKIVHVEYEGPSTEKLSFWAEVDSTKSDVERNFEMFATGQHIPVKAQYVGTAVISPNKNFTPVVYHLYETFPPVKE